MEKRSILHMFDPMPTVSPFDVNMAMDAGFDVLMPYSSVKLENVHGLAQDAIFSRGPAGIKRTALFIGGRDLALALDMLNSCKQAMVPPFEVSVFADPSGAFTTAAALVGCVESELQRKHQRLLADVNCVVFGGTGAVGIATGIIASQAGARVVLTDHLSVDSAAQVADIYNRRFNCHLQAAVASNDHQKIELLTDADVVFCTAKAGIQVLNAVVLKEATQLKVAGDVNAVPPTGIEGVKRSHFGEPLLHAVNAHNAVGIGALAVGDIKYQLQHRLLKAMLDTEQPLYLDFRDAFIKVRELLQNRP
jgi:methylene-tetrahydromethanopterin dehydrogenase